MVTRPTRAKGSSKRRRAPESTPRPTPAAEQARRFAAAELKTRLDKAGRRLQAAHLATRKFARSSMHEVVTAASASREPMVALLRTFRLAGRHIIRDAATAWQEVAPTRTGAMKPAVPRAARRSA